jgi:hypothetical protein
VSGAVQKTEYLESLKATGFENVRVVKEKDIVLPDDLVAAYLSEGQRSALKASGLRILSVTVQGSKPRAAASCCTPLAEAGACCSAAA